MKSFALVSPLVAVIAGLLAGAASPALGASPGGELHVSTFWKVVNFAILAGAIGYAIHKVGVPFFNSRTRNIQERMGQATALQQEAAARQAETERRFNNIAAEIEALRQEAAQELAVEGERLRLRTEQTLAKVDAQAQQQIAATVKAARQEVRAYSAELAISLAEQKIRGSLTREMQDSLVHAFVVDLAGHAQARPERGLS